MMDAERTEKFCEIWPQDRLPLATRYRGGGGLLSTWDASIRRRPIRRRRMTYLIAPGLAQNGKSPTLFCCWRCALQERAQV